MIVNYHTHTPRCGHAAGTEREYVEAALRAGIRTLGFSDHTPHDYGVPYRNSRVRMAVEELPAYADTVRGLAAEYRDRLEILLGVEAEYYPRHFARLLELLRLSGVRYMILGQHFLGNEIGEPYCGRPTDDPAVLERYVSQSIEALQTGLFSYFAHCRAAKDGGVPLEINLLGIREGRSYPDERFWRIAAEEGNAVVIGCDAHRPEHLLDRESEEKALALAERLGLQLTERVRLREI